MTDSEALPILQALADGKIPGTAGTEPDGALARPEVIRALYAAIDALQERESRATRGPEGVSAGRTWPPSEDARLRSSFAEGKSVSELAAAHGRTPGAIRSRLVRLGVVVYKKDAR
jgi:hypothetical protein